MKKTMLILALAALPPLLAGCGPQPPTAEPTTAADGRARPAGDTFARQRLDQALPGGFEMPFDYHLRSDRVVDGEGPERRIQVDVFGADADGALEAITRNFRDQGFRASRPRDRTEGGQRVVYRHADGRHATASTWTPEQKKTVAPRAEAVAYIAWRLESASAEAQDGEGEGAPPQ